MNTALLQDYINAFERVVIDSGFKRDLDDYASSLPASQNNIVTLREIAKNVLSVLDHLYGGDLPDDLGSLLPSEQTPPFTLDTHDAKLRALIEDTEIQQDEFFRQLTEFLNQLIQQIKQNVAEIEKIEGFIQPYISEDAERIATEGIAILAIVFKDQQTITNLKEFTKTLQAWSKFLPVYHQLLKSESPEDIQIVEIQNSSIDIVVNLNIDVSLNLVELFKLGFQVFAAYLSYKQLKKNIIDSYHGNRKLIAQEKETEKLLLGNIGEAITKKIKAQHQAAKKLDKGVDITAITTKVGQVSKLITAHIVKGNDLKLLALPEGREPEGDEDDSPDEREALREQSAAARRLLRSSPPEAQQKLLEAYGTLNEEAESPTSKAG